MTLKIRSSVSFSVASAFVTLIGIALVQCASLPAIESGTCGNGTIEPGEDCDTFAVGQASCRPAGSNGACRLDCSPREGAETAACPSGWGCGLDRLCRKPTGTFVASEESITAGAWHVRAGDFDGDGRADLLTEGLRDGLGAAKMRAHYFGANARLETSVVLPPPIAAANSTDMNGDGKTDVLYCDTVDGRLEGGRIEVLAGESERRLFPVAYPSFIFPGTWVMLPLIGPIVEGTPVSVVVATGDETGMIIAHPNASTQGNPNPLLVLPKPLSALAGMPVPAHLLDGRGVACDDLAIALTDETQLIILPICKKAKDDSIAWNDGATPHLVTLPAGAKIERGVRVADLDKDSHQDLLIGANVGGKHVTLVAYGDGENFYPDANKFGAPNTASALPLSLTVFTPTGEQFDVTPPLPLVVSDVSGDGTLDYLLPNALLMSGAPPNNYWLAYRKATGAWSEAVVGDFNGNGLTDIVAGSNDQFDLDFFNGTGSPIMNTFSIPTNGTTLSFAKADYDGDLIADVAFAQKARGEEVGSRDSLSILFGRAGTPDTPVVVGSFEKILEVCPFTFEPATASIGVLSTLAPLNGVPQTGLAVLDGNGDRQPRASYALADQNIEIGGAVLQGQALTLAGGKFVDKTTDVIVLARDRAGTGGRSRFWFLKNNGSAEFSGVFSGPDLSVDVKAYVEDDRGKHATALMAAGDMDHDGLDEAVAAVPFGSEAQTALFFAKAKKVTETTWGLDGSPPLLVPKRISVSGSLAVADVDGDGHADIVLLSGSIRREDNLRRELTVFWNDGAGHFDANRITAIVPSENEEPNAFAILQTNPAGNGRLGFVTATGLWIANMAPGSRAVTMTKVDSLRTGTGIAAADIDGDGLEDMAVIEATNLRIYRGQAVQP